jgi:hypothetical protein
MKYNITTFRKAGLEVKRGTSRDGRYIISVRRPGAKRFVAVDYFLWYRMQRYGVLTALDEFLNRKEGVE